MLSLISGSCCIHMCATTITHFGLGNGSSLVICAGIIAGEMPTPQASQSIHCMSTHRCHAASSTRHHTVQGAASARHHRE
jgi:preprotein translocase subunit SecY